MYGVSEGPFDGWGSPLILATVIVGLVLLLTLVLVEKRRTHPLIDIRLFSDRLFRSAERGNGHRRQAPSSARCFSWLCSSRTALGYPPCNPG